ncbi:MAG TPA: hypothetical protein VHO25_16185 [Polyangiaceae bacterium]|nr:hypothetical protein [Polyangiaceae bacterium]
MIAVCVRIHKAERWVHTRQQYEQQAYRDKCLVVVANGCDIDVSGILGKVLVKRHTEPLGYGGAANACLEAALESGADIAAFFDAGDQYDPPYLDKVAAALTDHDACGQGGFWLKSTYGLILQCPERCDCPCEFGMSGGTLAVKIDKALPFDEQLPKGEDRDWVTRMLKAKRRVRSVSPDHYTKIPTQVTK